MRGKLKILPKRSFKFSLLVAIAVGSTLFLGSIFFLTFYLPGHVYSNYYPGPTPVVVGLPVRLEIPKINVDAIIEYVGIMPDGTMGVPKGPDDVAWFKLGPKPGEIGSAVISGHYGYWKNGDRSVFDDLNELRKGDEVYIIDEKGATITFIVRELQRYNLDENASKVFGSKDAKAHLNLITCEGIWDKTTKTYSQRLVIFADKK